MKPAITLTLIVLVALLASCTSVSEIEKAITDFDQVEVSRAFNVDISQGEAFSVVIRVDNNLVEHLEVVKEGNTLKIGLAPDSEKILARTQQVEITMPELTRLRLSGACDGTITGFKSTKALEAILLGASSLQGDVEAGDVLVNADGASQVTLSGSGQNLTVAAAGASTVDLTKFSAADANVYAGGSSEVTVNPSGKLDAVASGNSTIYYLGSPILGTIEKIGDSEVRPK